MTLYTPFGSVFTFGNCTLSLTDGVLFGLIIGLCLCLSVYRRRSLFQKFCYLLLYSYVGALVALTIPLILPAGWDLSSQGTADASQSYSVDSVCFFLGNFQKLCHDRLLSGILEISGRKSSPSCPFGNFNSRNSSTVWNSPDVSYRSIYFPWN